MIYRKKYLITLFICSLFLSCSAQWVSSRDLTINPATMAVMKNMVATRSLATRPLNTLRFDHAVVIKPDRDIKDAGGKGPGKQQVNLLVGSGLDIALFERGCSLESWVYEDLEPASGLYYFAPRAYRIAWTPQDGYALRFQYNTKEGADDKTAVLMMATLSGGYNLEDRKILEQLARQSSQIANFKSLKPLPIYDMQVQFKSFMTGFQIPADQITAIPANNIAGDIQLTIAMSEQQIEEVIASLQSPQGIMGQFSFPLEAGETPVVTHIPIVLSLCNYTVVSAGRWERGDPFINNSDFPCRLKRLTALTIKQNRLQSYGYRLGDILVPPRQIIPIRSSVISEDSNVLKYFFDTELRYKDCQKCMDDIVAGFRKGIAQARVENLEMTVSAEVFTTYKLYEVLVQVESPYFTPTAAETATRIIKFTADNNSSTDIPLYLHTANTAKYSNQNFLFRYRITVITEDGERFTSSYWVKADMQMGNYIGKKQIEATLQPPVEKKAVKQNALY